MRQLIPFYPNLPPRNLAVTAVSQVVQLTGMNPQMEISLRVVNTGSKPAFLVFGKNDQVAASDTTGIVVMNGAPAEIINVPENITHMAYASAAADTTTLQIVLGRGGI